MSNRPARRARSQSGRRPAPSQSNKKLWMWIVAGVLVVAAVLLIAIVSTSGSDDKVSEGTVGTGNSSSPAETQPVTVLGDALPTPPDSGADTAIGLTAPTLQGFSFDGTPIDITPGGGRAKMVVFLAHWCPHCNKEIPVLQAWAASRGVPDGLDIVGVSTAVSNQRDNYPPSQWIVNKNWTWPIMADSAKGDAAIAYGVAGFPTFTIVGADGKVKLRSSGELSIDELSALVSQALAG